MSQQTFTCPSCSQRVSCDDSYGGEEVPCPTSGSTILVPQPTGQQPPSATAPGTLPPPTNTGKGTHIELQQPQQLRPWLAEKMAGLGAWVFGLGLVLGLFWWFVADNSLKRGEEGMTPACILGIVIGLLLLTAGWLLKPKKRG